MGIRISSLSRCLFGAKKAESGLVKIVAKDARRSYMPHCGRGAGVTFETQCDLWQQQRGSGLGLANSTVAMLAVCGQPVHGVA